MKIGWRIGGARHCEESAGPREVARPDDRLRDDAIQIEGEGWIANPEKHRVELY